MVSIHLYSLSLISYPFSFSLPASPSNFLTETNKSTRHEHDMVYSKIRPDFRLLFVALLFGALLVRGTRVHVGLQNYPTETESSLKNDRKRMLIGSVAPTCTYNECRGCKYKCRAEQVPVEGNDPINSPYHYKCVCHR